MNATQWRQLLDEVSRVILAQDQPENEDGNRPEFSPEVHAAGYIGFEGATEEQIMKAETRLGVKFPPSYRAFLSVSNGWPLMWGSIEPGQLWSTKDIRWARDQDPELLAIWGEYSDVISIEEHLQGRDDGFGNYGKQYVANLLSISEHGDACELLLCPDVVDESGEWECWKASSWGGTPRWGRIEEWFRDVIEFHSRVDEA